jgi:hypothetical protein
MRLPGQEEPRPRIARSSTFADNLDLPIHRWFRFPAGFSAVWAAEVIRNEAGNGRAKILDPFAGSGTALLEAELSGAQSIGIEAHPFVARVARAKLQWRENPEELLEFGASVLRQARSSQSGSREYPPLVRKCFTEQALTALAALHHSWETQADGGPLSQLTWLALVSILRECSPVGTAQWQYILPKKRKASVCDPFDAFWRKVRLMAQDMRLRQSHPRGPDPSLIQGDARSCQAVPDGWADLVVTSPPYANNYDYADATRLEMSFLREIQTWGDLQQSVRSHLIRSCTQHVAGQNGEAEVLLADSVLDPIKREIGSVCRRLDAEREGHGGKKPYHTMIAAYFHDMAHVWLALRRATCSSSLTCFVIGDSAPYGVHVPVDKWLGELAVSAGFRSYRFEKCRDRNVKWKNRKHRVPLHEGHLWVEG